MENNMLDVTIAVQSLRDYVEKVGKRDVKMAGYQNAVVSSVKLGNGNIKSIKDELGNLLGFNITNYTLDEICNKVLDKAVDLSSDWKYQFEYRFVPNIKKPTFILFTIWNKENGYVANELNEYKSLEKKGEEQMVEKKKRVKSSNDYTKEEMDFMQKLYAGKVDAAEKFYKDKAAKQEMPLQTKYQLEEYFKAKYPKYESKKPGNIWQAFYKKRILPRKSVVMQLLTVEDEVKQELDTVDTVPVVEYKAVEEQPKYNHIPLSDYVEKVRTYIINVGVGEHKSVAIDFINSVFNTGSYVNSKTIASFAKVLRKSLVILNEDDNFEYMATYSMSKIDKQSDDNSAKNMELTITCELKDEKSQETQVEDTELTDKVEDTELTYISTEENENMKYVDMIDSCIDKHKIYKHYTVSFLLGYYYKRKFRKNKFLGVRPIRLELIIDSEHQEDELDKEVRKNIELAVKPVNPDDKLEVKLEPVDGRDYTVILAKEIVI